MRSLIRSVTTLGLCLSLATPGPAAANAWTQPPPPEHSPNDPVQESGQELAERYQHLTAPEKEDIARRLYIEAETHAENLEWNSAIRKYEAAYFLVPSKHGFAYKVGVTAWRVGNCQMAFEYLSHLVNYGANQDKLADKVAEGRSILAEIESSGCAKPVEPAVEADPEPVVIEEEEEPQPDSNPEPVRQVMVEGDNPLGPGTQNDRLAREARLSNAAKAQRRGLLISGIVISSLGALGFGAAGFLHWRSAQTANELKELSAASTATRFPSSDYACRYLSQSDPCARMLTDELNDYNLVTPIAYGVSGGLVAVGLTFIIIQRVKVAKLRKKTDLVGSQSTRWEWTGSSPLLLPQCAGASASIRL